MLREKDNEREREMKSLSTKENEGERKIKERVKSRKKVRAEFKADRTRSLSSSAENQICHPLIAKFQNDRRLFYDA